MPPSAGEAQLLVTTPEGAGGAPLPMGTHGTRGIDESLDLRKLSPAPSPLVGGPAGDPRISALGPRNDGGGVLIR